MRKVSVNLRVDNDKYCILERMRKTGFGFAETQRNRSDVYNEAIGFGISIINMKAEMGERDFEKMWRLLNKLDLRKVNVESVEKMLAK
jgi:hypothetical protein